MEAILGEWGHPEDRFPSVHIAGTNGKGSVSALISHVLTRAGLKFTLAVRKRHETLEAELTLRLGGPAKRSELFELLRLLS